MPPLPSQKGSGKKGRGDLAKSCSRNTTPSIVGPNSAPEVELGNTTYLNLPISHFRTSDDGIDKYGLAIPNSRDLDALMERLKKLFDTVDQRATVCDRGMRMVADFRKDRLEEIEVERRDQERKEVSRKDAADEEERSKNKANKIKKKKEIKEENERPLTHGAHGLAPQDGTNIEHPPPGRKARRPSDGSASSSLSPVSPATPAIGMDLDTGNDYSSSDEHQPKPAPAIAQMQTFGDDPSTYPDPTIYEIREITPGMDDELKKEIYSVAVFPSRDLEDLIPGNPPDKDFSNAKPTNQVQANTFATYLEPYFRSFTEEDLAFLRERGDRIRPYQMPPRGKRHYTEIWAEEDGAISVDMPAQGRDKPSVNQARGSLDSINDDVGETDHVSCGPVLNRLLAGMIAERRAPATDDNTGASNGETADPHAELNDLLGVTSDAPGHAPPATYMPDSASDAWKKAVHPRLDHQQVDERIKQELRHIGFLPLDTEPNYDAHFDDEIAARLRFLQAKLKEQSIINGARKARLTELVKERMAHQEYSTILEDLDGQVQTAYLKRTRTMGKSKKSKRPGGGGSGTGYGGSGGAGIPRPGIGDVTKMLMDRRQKWINSIGLVFDSEFKVPRLDNLKGEDTSIFKAEDMAEFIARERELDEEGEEE
ncbi:histone acetyltransferases subunit 3-domain-containing protein [Calycina marina]|uniref:Histone acetyltransferases subunit 3-domain-containing protein n=1 Tax=Calycina marina TaxID=1763456 RepID=A0A9P7YZK4_9HELO|nr:histone acetyltransferases subunit 3-domain-containing protein [Calycina marina]